MWQKFVYLGLAGATGTIARYLLSGVIQRNVTTIFPLGTAAALSLRMILLKYSPELIIPPNDFVDVLS